MNKVLIIGWKSLNKGGIQNVIMSIVRNLSRDFIFDIVLFTNENGYYDKEFESYGGKIFRLVHYSGKSIFRDRLDIYIRKRWIQNKIENIIINHGPYDAIHCNKGPESAYILQTAMKCNINIRIIHSHSILGNCNCVRSIYNKKCLRIIDKCATKKIGCSDTACLSLFGVNSNYEVILNPYDENLFSYNEYEGNNKNIVIAQIGRLCTLKNQLFSLKIINSLSMMKQNVLIYFVGDDFYNTKKTLLNYINACNINKNVKFLPSTTDIPCLLKKCSYTLLPSFSEGFGIVAIESQACGVKCIASDRVPKTTNCGGCIYLPLSLEPEKWAYYIMDDFTKTGGKHFEYDCSKYTTKHIVNQYKNLYIGKY